MDWFLPLYGFLILFSIFLKIKANDLQVTTPFGTLKEEDRGWYLAFEGIPYGEPPVGNRRFEPTIPFQSPWKGVRDSTKPGQLCLQWIKVHNKPWLITETKDEGLYPVAEFNRTLPMEKINDVSDIIGKRYIGDAPIDEKSYKRFCDISTDRLFHIGADKSVRGMGKHIPTYMYYYTYKNRYALAEMFSGQRILNRSGDVAVITGGAAGIGFHVVKKLLQKDFHVILGVRNLEKGNLAIENIRKEGITTGKIECTYLDLNSLDSVRIFAQTVLTKTNSIHILFNNAGIMAAPFKVTEDNLESQFQVNYLSHFLLTNLLLPCIVETGSRSEKFCRIVNTSSFAHYGGNLNFEDLQSRVKYSALKAYFDSKLAQVINTVYLNQKMVSQGSNVRVYCLHPGSIPTGLWDHLGLLVQIIKPVTKCIFLNGDQGAQLVMYAAMSPDIESDGGIFLFNNRRRQSNPQANDVNIQQKLWDESIKLINFNDQKV